MSRHRRLVVEALEQRQLLSASPFPQAVSIPLTAAGIGSVTGKIALVHGVTNVGTYTFTSPLTGTLVVREMSGPGTAAFPTVFTVYNASGQPITSIYNDPPQPYITLDAISATKNSVYYATVAAQGNTYGPYSIQITPDDTGNTFALAVPITLLPASAGTNAGSATQAGDIFYPGDVNLYSFTATVTGNLTITQKATLGSTINSALTVFNAAHTQITQGGAPGTLNATVTVPVVAGTSYYVEAASFMNTTGGYSLNFSTSPPLYMGIADPGLSALVKQLFTRDGSLTREDTIQILYYTVNNSTKTLSATDFADLKTIVKQDSASFDMPNYVRVLSSDVVFGSYANRFFTGGQDTPTPLGNLQAGSSAKQMDELVGKWFLGTDLPQAACDWLGTDVTWAPVSGTLYGSVNGVPTPQLDDAQQGDLGDCYFIASVTGIANVDPTAIENMILYNGVDPQTGLPSWTVRFYNYGVANYVTVNNELPIVPQSIPGEVSAGALNYNGTWTITNASSTSNVLWLSLIEKAYAQWNETGYENHAVANSGPDGVNSYEDIAGGYSQPVFDQVLGGNDNSQQIFASYSALSATQELSFQAAAMPPITGTFALSVGAVMTGSISFNSSSRATLATTATNIQTALVKAGFPGTTVKSVSSTDPFTFTFDVSFANPEAAIAYMAIPPNPLPAFFTNTATAGSYSFSDAQEATLIQALGTPNTVVTIGTETNDNYLYGGHMYTVVGYDATTGDFTLHNPWGNAIAGGTAPFETGSPVVQPPPVPWSELNSDCDVFAFASVGDTQTFLSRAAALTPPVMATKVSPDSPKFYATAGSAGAANPASAAGAWYAISNAEANLKKDPFPATTHDLALLAYLA
ncbi:MAG: C2 family cysteine protease [Thermoguttaceae bacterium]